MFVLIVSLLIGNLVPFASLGRASIENRRVTRSQSGEGPLAEGITLIPEKQVFGSDEEPRFTLEIDEEKVEKNILGFGPKPAQAAETDVEAALLYRGNVVDIPKEINKKEDGNFDIKLKPDQSFTPGRYTLQTTVVRGEAVYQGSQDFTWGVLAINTNKSIYLSNEMAKLAMAVLDDKGNMVCDAKLTLNIKRPAGIEDKLSTEDGTIKVNPECRKKAITQKPDYEAEYKVGGPRTYQMTLSAETPNGNYTISDAFEVRESVAFDIERNGPTRIYPINPYPVTLTITAHQDFIGVVEETVPESFEVTEGVEFRVEGLDDKKIISWDVDWKMGETYELSYEFKAPNISPQFYLLGPLRFMDEDGREAFEEARQWQIAADLTAGPNYAGAVGTTNQFTTPANAVGSTETTCTDDYGDAIQIGFWNTFGFAIPTGDTINGIQVEVKWAYNSDPPVAGGNGITVVKSESVLGTEQTFATAEPAASTACGATQEIDTKGGAADLWGLTWTPAEINAASFGVRIRKSITGNEDGLNINWIRVTVTHTAGGSTYEQSAYRWYANQNSTDVGSALAALNTGFTKTGTEAFRLRALIHVGGAQLGLNGENFKLQFAQRGGDNLCDTGFVQETYADVTTVSVIRYNDNTTPADEAALTSNVNDPTHGADTVVDQSYQELNNFTNSVAAIPAGQDGNWDFALVDSGATAGATYCLRIVLSTGGTLNTYTVVPELTIPENPILLFGLGPVLMGFLKKFRKKLKR